jgi:Coenzyme PQQ synthesis protein D (PqqD)
MTLHINTDLAAEAFDGEVVLIDIQRAVYFSLRGAAAELWMAFSEPRPEGVVLDALMAHWDGVNRAELQATIAQMQSEKLLLVCATNTPACATAFAPTAPSYVSPYVEAFSDLADLIAIDPVHEVDAGAGWPVKPSHFPDVD